MSLSVIIAALNEPHETLNRTIKSCYDTSDGQAEIVLVDDCSSTPLRYMAVDPRVKIVENAHRCGVGPSRTIGVHHASGEYVLIIDAHNVFFGNWYAEAMRRIEGRPKTVHCATCLGLDSNHMDPANPVGEYHGATINVCGPDRNGASHEQVLECVWGSKDTPDDAEIAAVMGACYFLPRAWFLKLDPLANLHSWGSDELFLSVKSWLAGGDCRLMNNVRICHKFTLPKERQPFSVPPGATVFNKLLGIYSLTPPPLAQMLAERFKGTVDAREWQAGYEMFRNDYSAVAVELARNKGLFVHDFGWLAAKFGLTLPT